MLLKSMDNFVTKYDNIEQGRVKISLKDIPRQVFKAIFLGLTPQAESMTLTSHYTRTPGGEQLWYLHFPWSFAAGPSGTL